jgi:ABC-2 type transport system permease protein
MRKAMIIARREYKALVRTKAFMISLLIMPVLMCGGIVVQIFLSGRVDVSEKKVVVLDGTGRLFEPLQTLARLHNENAADTSTGHKKRPTIVLEKGPEGPVTDDLRVDLSNRIHRNELFAFMEIDPDALKPASNSVLLKMLQEVAGKASADAKTGEAAAEAAAKQSPSDKSGDEHDPVRLYSESMIYNDVLFWLTQSLNQAAFALRLQDAGLNPLTVAGAVTPIPYEELGLYTRESGGEIHKGDESRRSLNLFMPLGLMMLMFMSVMVVGQPMLTSVLEEKQQRIAEVLLGSASPFQLMMGKLMGNVGVALTIVGLYMTGGYLVAAHYGYADMLPMWLLGWFLAFEVLACILFGAIFIAIGAACSEIKDAQSLLMPVMILIVFPLMVWFNVLQEPLSSFAQWISLFPPATPMLMLLRMAASPMIPMWQPIVGIVLVLLSTLACVFAAGRVFRIGLLMQGKAPKLNELARWIAHG